MNISDLRFGSLDENLLDIFEKSLGRELPSNYRLFLKSFNGGCLNPNAFEFPILDDLIIVDVLFSLGVDRDFDLRVWREECKNELPLNMLVIGGDPFGCLFILALDGTGVYFWDQIGRFEMDSNIGNAYLLTASFTEFLEKLVETHKVEIAGPRGSKLLENIWHDSGGGQMQEINRLIYSEFSRVGDFKIR